MTPIQECKVTSIQELREYAKGAVVNLPPFAEGQPFCARLKRPALLDLVRKGKIPNRLLSSASTLFEGGIEKALSMPGDETMNDLFDVMDAICKASFVEPTYDELKANDITLTDEQMMFVFAYSQNGVRQLDSFRQE